MLQQLPNRDVLWRFVTNSARGRPAIVLPRNSSGMLRVSWLALMASLGLTGRHWPHMGPRRGLRLPRSRRSPGDWRTGVSPHHTMARWHAATSDVGGRVADYAGCSIAAEWPDPEGDDGAPIPDRRLRLNQRNWVVAVATANGQAFTEWAKRGDERRHTAAHDRGILLGAFRTALVLGVDEAGSDTAPDTERIFRNSFLPWENLWGKLRNRA